MSPTVYPIGCANRQTLLFTGGGGAGSQALFELLNRRYKVHFADGDPEAKPCFIPTRCWHSLPLAGHAGFIDALRRLCAELAVDLLVPGVDEELTSISEAADTFDCDILLPSPDYVRTCLDKLTTHQFLREAKLPTPITQALRATRNLSGPCILKPRRGRGSRNVSVVQSEHELESRVASSGLRRSDFIIQEFLQGTEYTVTVVADRNARLRAIVPVRVGLKRGITLRAETEQNEQVISACAAIHRAWPSRGCINVQLMRTDAGAVMPFEINPRISTTACLVLAAGIDFVGLFSPDATAPEADRNGLMSFRNGVRLRRSWYNELVG